MIALAVVLVVLSIMLAACTAPPSSASASSHAVASPVGRPAMPADPVPEPAGLASLEPLVPLVADHVRRGRRDPFAPLRVGGASNPPRSTLASARLAGIVRGAHGPLILVETLDGTGVILRAGERLEEGYLLDIGADFALFGVGPPSASTPTRVVLRLEPTP